VKEKEQNVPMAVIPLNVVPITGVITTTVGKYLTDNECLSLMASTTMKMA
jgi:hypothetical protein